MNVDDAKTTLEKAALRFTQQEWGETTQEERQVLYRAAIQFGNSGDAAADAKEALEEAAVEWGVRVERGEDAQQQAAALRCAARLYAVLQGTAALEKGD